MPSIRLLACALAIAVLGGCADSDTSRAKRIAEDAEPGEVAPMDASDGTRGRTARVLPEDTAGAATTDNPAGVITMTAQPPMHLTDASGASVYMLEGNTDGSRCDAICEEVWPPVVATVSTPQAGAGVDSNLLGTTPRGDGSMQVDYGNNPLYRYAGDRRAGRTTGHQVTDRWGRWTLVGLDGEPLQESLPPNAEPQAPDAQQQPSPQG